MRSGIKSDIGLSLNTQSEFGAYTKENLIRIVFENLKREKPRGTFEYSNFEYLLLGMAIDGRKNKSARALHDGLQVPLGAEFDLIWNTDDNGFLHYEGGAVMAAPDLAKVGQMMLDGGEVAGMPLISRAWHARSTGFKRDIQFDSENGPQIQFQNGWRQVLRPHGPPDYFAAGDLGQFLYVSPSHNVVIVRNGFSYGHIPFKDWIVVFYNAATRLDH